VLTDRSQTHSYLHDWRGVFRGDALAVVRPASTIDIAHVVRACVEERVAIVPQGGNTGLSAGATPIVTGPCIVLALERMKAIRTIDPLGYTIAVEAGAVLADVQHAARQADRLFPLSLAAEGSAQIGGLLATNAGGTAVLRYGTMRALALGIEAVLPNASVVDGMRALRKDNAGYDWKQVLIGSEGTLGVITAATLRLFPRPKHFATALIGVDAVEDALAAYSSLQVALGESLSACELIPDRAIAMRIEHESRKRPMTQHAWYVLAEGSSNLSGLDDAFESVLAGYDGVLATSSEQSRGLWEWREAITESEKRAGRSAKHDVSVPLSAIPRFIAEATEAVEKRHPSCGVLAFGHIGDGNIHFNVLLDGGATADAVNATVHAIVAKYRGSITAEHGIGRYRVNELRAHRSEEELTLMRKIKAALDPQNIMNPGAVFG
jgi:FAD/FMN-containing dehydrogenase